MAIIAPAGFEFLPPLVNPIQVPEFAPPAPLSSPRLAEPTAPSNAARANARENFPGHRPHGNAAGQTPRDRYVQAPTYGGMEGMALLSAATGRALLDLTAAAREETAPGRPLGGPRD